MKRYIYAATKSNPDIFKFDTGTSYYNNFLNQKDLAYMEKSKNRTGKIVYMTPAEYYHECATKIFEKSSIAELKRQRSANSELIKQYEKDMLSGDKFPLCYLNYAPNGEQEGLHRMMAAGNVFGWNTEFPVLVVTVVDDRVEELNSIWRYWNDAVYDAEQVTYRRDTWEEEFVEEVEYNLEHSIEKNYKVIITSRRDREECAKYNMDYAIEIALADFQDIMHPMTVFEPNLKDSDEQDNDIDIDDELDDLDWDSLLTL